MKTKSVAYRIQFIGLALAAIFTTSSSAQASLLAVENYNSYTLNSSTHNANGGSGWGGTWFASNSSNGYLFTARNSPTFTYTGYDGTTTPATSGGLHQNLASGFGGDQSTYLQRSLDTTGGGSFGSAGLLSGGSIGADSTTLWGSFLYTNDTSGNTGNTTFSLDFRNGGSSAYSLTLAQPLSTNLIVFKINFGAGATDTVTTWINPTLATFDGTTGGNLSAAGNYSFNALRIGTTYGLGAGSQTGFEDIRLGTSLADVAPVTVPEPSTFALLGAGVLSLAFLRRRQKKA